MNRIGKNPACGCYDYILIFIGTLLMGVAINGIFDPCELVTGGFSGLAIVIKSVTESWIDGGIPLWLSSTILNIPLFIIGIYLQGMKAFSKTLFGTLCLSAWLFVVPDGWLILDDILLSALFGGAILGAGIGLVFIGHGTTGGTDLIAALVWRRMRHYTIAQIMQVIDGIIVVLGAWIFGIQKALYAVIAILVVTKISDMLMEGLHFAKAAYIITNHPGEMADRLMERLNRGVTGIASKGMYTNSDRTMLYCVVGKKELVELKDIVMEMDKGAFVIVSDAREVVGEGFSRHPDQTL